MSESIPILLIDLADFTLWKPDEQEEAILRLQAASTEAARFFAPFGDVWSRWSRHGTGDGYYFLFDSLPHSVAMKYAFELANRLDAAHQKYGETVRLRLRMVLGAGRIHKVGDQLLGDVLSEAERIQSHTPFKFTLTRNKNWILAATDLFHAQWSRKGKQGDHTALEIPTPDNWIPFAVKDKHGKIHQALLYGSAQLVDTAEPKVLDRLKSGEELLHDDKLEEAEIAFAEVMAAPRDTENPEITESVARAMVQLGKTWGRLGKTPEELNIYEQILKDFGQRPEYAFQWACANALKQQAEARYLAEQYQESILALERLIGNYANLDDPEMVELINNAYLHLAECQVMHKQFSQALEMYGKLENRLQNQGKVTQDAKIFEEIKAARMRYFAAKWSDTPHEGLREFLQYVRAQWQKADRTQTGELIPLRFSTYHPPREPTPDPFTPSIYPQIKRLEVDGFKSLTSPFAFSPTTRTSLLTGTNGSGKSTLLQLLAFLADYANGKTREFFAERSWPVEDIQSKTQKNAAVHVHLVLGYGADEFYWEFIWNPVRKKTEWEYLAWSQPDSVTILFIHDPALGVLLNQFGEAALPEKILLTHSMFSITDNFYNRIDDFLRDQIQVMQSWLQGIHVVELFNLQAMRAGKEKPQQHLTLGHEGQYLIHVLDGLGESARERILKRLGAHYQCPVSMEIRKNYVDGSLDLYLVEQFDQPLETHARHISDGFMRLLAMSTLAELGESVSLIALDEAENGIGPHILQAFISTIIDDSPQTQIILTTHSPVLVNLFDADEIHLMIRGEYNNTLCAPLSGIPWIKEHLEHQGSADIWFYADQDRLKESIQEANKRSGVGGFSHFAVNPLSKRVRYENPTLR